VTDAPLEKAYVGIGTNLGNREAQVAFALSRLAAIPDVRLCRHSTVIETEPVGPPQGRYLNSVVELETRLGPFALLIELQRIECFAGRRRVLEGVRLGPRLLDLDLLLHASRILEQPRLTLPHPRLHERAFVLEPLAEIAPTLVHPVLGESVAALAAKLRIEDRAAGDGQGL